MKRHTCIICGSKRYESKMTNVFLNSWACSSPKYYFQRMVCSDHKEISEALLVLNIISKWKLISLNYLSTLSNLQHEISSNVSPEQTNP